MSLLARLGTLLFDAVAPRRCAGCGSWGYHLCFGCESRLRAAPAVPALGDLAAAFAYDDPISRVIQAGKYGGAATALRRSAEIAAGRLGAPAAIRLIPIPLGARRWRGRGYNQAEIIAGAFGSRLDIPVLLGLIRTRDTSPQVGKTKAERDFNLNHAFAWTGPSLGGRHVALVDDVLTTGSTLNAARAALRVAGAGRVSALVLARKL